MTFNLTCKMSRLGINGFKNLWWLTYFYNMLTFDFGEWWLVCVCVACAASGPPSGSASGETWRGWHSVEETSELAGAVSEWKNHTVSDCSKYFNPKLAEVGSASWRRLGSSTDLICITFCCVRMHASARHISVPASLLIQHPMFSCHCETEVNNDKIIFQHHVHVLLVLLLLVYY